MYYYLYQITNKVNGKIYVGVHKTKSLNDGYMGSGSILKSAIQKHGILNFEKVILETFDDESSMYAREAEVVNDAFLARDDVYNIRRGGHGGFDHINKNGLNYKGYKSAADRNRIISVLKTDKGVEISKLARAGLRRMLSDPMKKQLWVASIIKTKIENGTLSITTQMQTPCARIKRKRTLNEIGHQQGSKNSQAGTMWITNEVENKKLKKTDQIPEGWRKGRIFLK